MYDRLQWVYAKSQSAFKAIQQAPRRQGIRCLLGIVGHLFYLENDYLIAAHFLENVPCQPTVLPGITICQVTAANIDLLGSMTDPANTHRLMRMFEGGGTIGFLALDNATLVGCSWLTFRYQQTFELIRFPLTSGDALLHDLFIVPTHRRRGIGYALMIWKHCYLKAHGYNRAISVTNPDNKPSLLLQQRLGYKEIGRLFHKRILYKNLFSFQKGSIQDIDVE